jgi:hypothetical protein
MATASIILTPGSAVFGDSTTDNIPPALKRKKGALSGADIHYLVLGFDGAGSVHESCYYTFPVPADYASGGTLKVWGEINSATGNVARMQAMVSAITPADADTMSQHAFGAAAGVDITANTTEAERLLQGDITLTMDSAAAGDIITIRLFRDPAHANDTHTTDFDFIGALFTYTTS